MNVVRFVDRNTDTYHLSWFCKEKYSYIHVFFFFLQMGASCCSRHSPYVSAEDLISKLEQNV
jgi:hypothetical protein